MSSQEYVHGFPLPEGKDASDLDWWPEFSEYFAMHEGFSPNPRDSGHKRLFEYYVEGAYQSALAGKFDP